MKKQINQLPCRFSLIHSSKRVMKRHMNTYDSLFGGEILAEMDDVASMAFSKHSNCGCMTASMDYLSFVHPVAENHVIKTSAFVSGVGSQSAEVFVKVTGESLVGEKQNYLVATCFVTLVKIKTKEDRNNLPGVFPESEEEKFICRDFEKRKRKRACTRKVIGELQEQLKKVGQSNETS